MSVCSAVAQQAILFGVLLGCRLHRRLGPPPWSGSREGGGRPAGRGGWRRARWAAKRQSGRPGGDGNWGDGTRLKRGRSSVLCSSVFAGSFSGCTRIRPPPVRDNCAEVRASAHRFGEKNIWLDSGESHEVSGGLGFLLCVPVLALRNGARKTHVPVRDKMTDRVRIAWNRTLQSHKLTKNRSICPSNSPQLASGSCLAPQKGAGRGQFERVQTRVQHKPGVPELRGSLWS